MQGRPSLAEVARESGVSVSTASRALNRPEMVSPAVVGRIREAAKRLGYAPNPFARSLRLQASKTIGVLVPDTSNPFFAEVARGIEAACYRSGYVLVLGNSDRSIDREAEQARVLFENRVDGVLLFSVGDASSATISWLLDHAVPVVLVERRSPGPPVDCVISDNAGGVRAAIELLVGLGHRRIACLAGDPSASHYAERLAAFRQLAQTHDLDTPPAWIRTHLSSFADGQRATAELLARADRPTALFCATDTLAIGAIREAARAGVRVPADLSVVGFSDIEFASYVHPPLTSVGQQKMAVGSLAVRLLLRRIRRRETDRETPVVKVVGTQLMVRESTGPAPRMAAARRPHPTHPTRASANGSDRDDSGLWGLT